MVLLPNVSAETDSPSDNLAEMLRDLRGYQPPTEDTGHGDTRVVGREFRLLLILRFLQEIQIALDIMQVNQDLALDQLNQKIIYLERVMEDVVHRDFIDR